MLQTGRVVEMHQKRVKLFNVLDLIHLIPRLHWGKEGKSQKCSACMTLEEAHLVVWNNEGSTNEMERLAGEQGDDSPAGRGKEQQTH